jgi:trimethylamine--corrinoid protein Co-methyltransferase
MTGVLGEPLSSSDIQAIHDTSMKLLQNVGIRFPDEEALGIFRQHGFSTEGEIVYFSENKIMDSVRFVPDEFTIHARNANRNVIVGNGVPVFAPGYGAPFLVDLEVGKRYPTMQDYHNLASLAHALPNQDLSGHLMVEPNDIPNKTSGMLMIYANILHSDKPFIGSTAGKVGAENTIKMSEILFGENLGKPVTMGLINPLSPMSYSPDMIQALMVYAQHKQPLTIAALIMAGTTGPVTLAGVLAQQNAELLAGIVLTQLITQGTPILYGSTSTNIDMRTSALTIGSPELSLCIRAHAQLARFYGFPSRGGGALTDSSSVDIQAGFESMLSLLTTVNSGIDFILHAAGILSSFMAFSYEKFVMDDEMCGMLRHFIKGINVSPETLSYDVIEAVGHDGHYLGHKQTLDRCHTEFWQPRVVDRSGLNALEGQDNLDAVKRAQQHWKKLLTEHIDPPLDPVITRQLSSYIEKLTFS